MVLFCDLLRKTDSIKFNNLISYWIFTSSKASYIYAWYLEGKLQQIKPQQMNKEACKIIKLLEIPSDNAYILVIKSKQILPTNIRLCDESKIWITGCSKGIKLNNDIFYNNFIVNPEKSIKLSGVQSSNCLVFTGSQTMEKHLKAISDAVTQKPKNILIRVPKNKQTPIEEEWILEFGQESKVYKSIQRNSNYAITKHLLKKKYYAKTYSESINKFSEKCQFCMMGTLPSDANVTLSGQFICLSCTNNGCFWHFTKDLLCINCAKQKNKWKSFKYKDIKTTKVQYKSMYYDINDKQYNACAIYNNEICVISNIPTSVQEHISKQNGENKKGYLNISVNCQEIEQKSEKIVGRENPKANAVLSKLKEIYDTEYTNANDNRQTDIYLTKYLKPVKDNYASRYKETYSLDQKYLIKKTAKMVDGDIDYGTTILTNSISESFQERCLLWSSYIKHIVTREKPILNKKGNKIGIFEVPNPTIIKKHEMAFENYFKYISNTKISLLNQKIFVNNEYTIQNTTLYSKIMLGNWYHTFDVSNKDKTNTRVTGVGCAENGGININKLYGFDDFANQIFEIGNENIGLCLGKQGKKFHFNSIQINSSHANLSGPIYSPKWHWDSTSIYEIGIITLHLKGWNSFITNGDMFPTSSKDLKNDLKRKEFIENVYKYGLIKEPRSTYVINNISTKYVNHAILNSNGLALIRDDYNNFLENKLNQNEYEIMNIKPTSDVIKNTETESWVLRYIPVNS